MQQVAAMSPSRSLETYPRVVKLFHGKNFKIGVDFEDIPGVGVVISIVHAGYPAAASQLVATGDVLGAVNGEKCRDVPHTLELCSCKGGRGTDEYVLLTLVGNESAKLQRQAAASVLKNKSSPTGILVRQLSRTLSFTKKKSKSDPAVGDDTSGASPGATASTGGAGSKRDI